MTHDKVSECTGSDWRQVTALVWWVIIHMQTPSLGLQTTCSVTSVS